MKKLIGVFIFCTVSLVSCIDTATNTVINADGSGTMLASVDFSDMLTMMAQGKEKGEEFKLDTTIYIRDHADTSSLLTATEKKLLREMMIKISIDVRDINKQKFIVAIMSPFKSPDDLNAINELMKKKEYDIIFDKAMKLPMFSGDQEEESSKENDNLFASVFPDFFRCEYKKNSITCRLDTAMYRRSYQELQKGEFRIDGEDAEKMFASATFINMITLPSGVKAIKGESMKKDKTDNQVVQTGNLLDLYRHPEKYEYSIQY